MSMGTRQSQAQQEEIWIANVELARSPGHPFYQRLNGLLDEERFDVFVEGLCRKFYALTMGRPGLAPGVYFRSLLIGYFEGIDSERGIAWRMADSLALREFVHIGITESTPDHSTISRTRRLIDVETHREVFVWVLGLLADRGLLKGKRVGVDATTLEASAAMRSIVRRDTGESYDEFLTGLAKASGIATPTREQLARLDRKRKKRTSNKEWKSPTDADARITKMKDGRTHLAHKAEHAVDLDTGAVVAVTLQEADKGDTATLDVTLCEAGEAVTELAMREVKLHPHEAPRVNLKSIEEMVADKGYHSGAVLEQVQDRKVRSYIPERQQKGQRKWEGKAGQQQAVYANRRHAAHAPAQAREHPEAAVDPCGGVQSQSDLPQVAGRRHAAGMEEPRGSAIFVIPGPIFAFSAPCAALSKSDRAVERRPNHAAAGADPLKTLPEYGHLHHRLREAASLSDLCKCAASADQHYWE